MTDTPDAVDPPGMPRWVKLMIIIGLLVLLIVVIVMFVLGGEHGPGRHASIFLSGCRILNFGTDSNVHLPSLWE